MSAYHQPFGSPAPTGAILLPWNVWSPAKLGGFIANPDNASTLTLSGSTITQLADDAGSSAKLTLGSGLTRDTSVQLGGHNTMAVTSSSQSLYTSSGGVTGTQDHSILLVARFDALPSGFLDLAGMGTSQGTAGGVSSIGTSATTKKYAFAGAFLVTPLGQQRDITQSQLAPTYNVLQADTTTFHVIEKVVSGGIVRGYVDGELVAGPTAEVFNITNGLGFFPHASGAMVLCHIAHAAFVGSAVSLATMRQYEAWAGQHFGSALGLAETRRPHVLCVGDSITLGTGAVTGTSDYPTQMSAMLSITSSVWNLGVGGTTLVQFAARAENDVAGHSTGLASSTVIVIEGGINDLVLGATAATTFTNLVAEIAAVKTYMPVGTPIIVCTVLYRATSLSPNVNSSVDSLNTMIKNNASTYGYIIADLAADARLNPITNSGAFADGEHPNALGCLYMADDIAPVVNPHLH